MLKVTVQKLGNTTVVRCQGRIVVGNAYSLLRNAVLSQRPSGMLVLDLAQVDRIDAGGLGVLLSLREWARSAARVFKLMNVTKNADEILYLTHLQRVFGYCSVPDLFVCCTRQLLCHPAQPISPIE
jgi:anti-sigma B factor antagonist